MTTHKQLTAQILGRIYVIHLLRRLTRPAFLGLYGFAAALTLAVPFVSVSAVLRNLAGVSGWQGVLQFHEDALLHTELAVQVALVIFALVCGVWIREAVVSMGRMRPHAALLAR